MVLVASMGKPVELGLVGLELLDKVDEMAGLLEQLKVLGVNQVPIKSPLQCPVDIKSCKNIRDLELFGAAVTQHLNDRQVIHGVS